MPARIIAIAHRKGGLFITSERALHRVRAGVAEPIEGIPGVPPQTSATLLDDDGLCCGAGGAYSVLQPELAGLIRDRKVSVIDRVALRSRTPAYRHPIASIRET